MRESLAFGRALLVLSSLSPVFLLWAVRGTSPLPEQYFIVICVVMIVVPNGYLWRRLMVARALREKRELVVGKAEDHRDHLLVYLFSMLLPMYAADLSSVRNFASSILALLFISFLFWHLNLHYMNLLFAVKGYRVFTIYPPEDPNPFSGRVPVVLITKTAVVSSGERLTVYRLTDMVYIADEEDGA